MSILPYSTLGSPSCRFTFRHRYIVMHARSADDTRGICYGCQEMAWRIDQGNVARGITREYGETELTIHKIGQHADRLFEGLGDSLNGLFTRPTLHCKGLRSSDTYHSIVFMSHFDKLVRLPEGFEIIATTKGAEFAGIAHQSKPFFGLLFPEISQWSTAS